MAEHTRQSLLREAEQHLRSRDTRAALINLVALVRSAPHDLDARMRVADVLLAGGRLDLAVQCYAAVAVEAAKMGFPLKAAVAMKVLGNFDPETDKLFDALASRYAAGSPALGRAARLSLPDAGAEVPRGAFPPAMDDGQLAVAAMRLVQSREGLPEWPTTVAPIPLLSELPPSAFARMISAVSLRRIPRGAVLLHQGEAGDAFYILARGRVRVTRARPDDPASDEELAVLGEGALLGEMALISAAPRTATVTALDDVDALAFGRESLQAVARELNVIAATLERFMRQRLLDHLLRTHPLFGPFDPAQRVQLASRFEVIPFAPGQAVITEGEEGTGLWVVLSGAVRVFRDAPGASGASDPIELAALGPGEIFGEMSLLDEAPTNASVVATAPSTLLLLPRAIFSRLVSGVPELRAYFENLADQRRMDTNLTMSLVPGEVWV